MLRSSQQSLLLTVARQSIFAVLTQVPLPPVPSEDPELQIINGVFVTLKKSGHLRGCIGHLVGRVPLPIGVQEMALSAAFHDPRFHPLTVDELPQILIEISVLSVPKPVKDIHSIVIGQEGLIIEQNGRKGVLLPQVALEQGWTQDQFLCGICHKAGLPDDAWKTATLQSFTAQVFHE